MPELPISADPTGQNFLKDVLFCARPPFHSACACFNLITLHFHKRWKIFYKKAELKACLKPNFF